jgi:hypothetical protein
MKEKEKKEEMIGIYQHPTLLLIYIYTINMSELMLE